MSLKVEALTDQQVARLHELNIMSADHVAALLRAEETRAMLIATLELDDTTLQDLCANLEELGLSTTLQEEPPLPPMGCLDPEET